MNVIIDDNLIFYGEEEPLAPKKKKEPGAKVPRAIENKNREVCCAAAEKSTALTAA